MATLQGFYRSSAFDPPEYPPLPSEWLPTGFDESVYDKIDGMFERGELGDDEPVELLAYRLQDEINEINEIGNDDE